MSKENLGEAQLFFRRLQNSMEKYHEDLSDFVKCEHLCTSNCRRNGCNCQCGEYHEETKYNCPICEDKGFIEKTEWTGTDDSYDVNVRCECQKD